MFRSLIPVVALGLTAALAAQATEKRTKAAQAKSTGQLWQLQISGIGG